LVILRGDEMAELPTDAVNSRYRPAPDFAEWQLSSMLIYLEPGAAARASPCPPAATTTTGNAYPRVASDSQPLEKYWPFASKRLGEEGTVIAALRIAPTGCVTGMAIIGSSGSDMLDSTVLKYLESAEFIPAGPDGKPAESQVAVPIVFKLEQ
jgi:protein TonB